MANVDLANSDSLKRVQFIDPQGWPMIGISLHLMGVGTHALDVMAHSSSTFLPGSSLPSLHHLHGLLQVSCLLL